MKELYKPELKARVSLDDKQRVRAINHSQEYWLSNQGNPVGAAIGYLNTMASVYSIPAMQLANLHQKVNFLNPVEQGMEYHLSEEKANFDANTLGFYQTYMNTPVWRAGFKVTIKQGPNRIVRSVNTSHDDFKVKMPSKATIEQFRKLFAASDLRSVRRRAGEDVKESEDAESVEYVRKAVGIREPTSKGGKNRDDADIRLIRGRFWIYQYDKEARFGHQDDPQVTPSSHLSHSVKETHDDDPGPTLPVSAVHKSIKDGQHYLVAEITFDIISGSDHVRPWRALIELETNSVLYLRPLSGNVNGLVFEQDPISKTGDVTLDSASTSATLNPHRDDVLLQNLDAPSDGTQSLSGTYAQLANVEGLEVTHPTEPAGTDFDYDVRTHDFASVSGYFHVDRLFRAIEDLGFPIATYFPDTSFPLPVDVRCWSNNTINAHCAGNGVGGIGHVGYGLMDNSDLVNPLGRVCDPRVTWHELCGHGILFEHVDDGLFGFAHSAGDGLAGIYFDPESNCWGVDGTAVNKPGDLRFTYVPWHPSLHRRFDRDVAAGWAWGGSQDNGNSGYGAEEILATTHFNIYRSIGGDSANLGRRQFASRMMLYLILRAVQNLTPATNPNYARDFAAELIAVDALNWTSEGVDGGAYNKVIRWAFEKQGEYQTPLITNGGSGDGTITTAGDPPDVDVYIDDGRTGEYEYLATHWHTTTIWNRLIDDDITGHEPPALGEINYAYVKIKNRGTQLANNVVVRGFHTKPGAGLLWPNDFEAFITAQIAVGTLGPNNSEEQIVGPFEWTPNINAYGHDCMLMIVSADDDPSNIDNFTAGEVVPEWRLVPNDNNVGQRNVNPVPGGGGSEGLMAGLNGISFFVGNPNPGRAVMTLQVELPKVLKAAGWGLEFDGVNKNQFELASGAKREIFMRLNQGKNFAKDQVEKTEDRDISIAVLADDNIIGGMTYRLDPNLSRPYNATRSDKCVCTDAAQSLADCLGFQGQKIKKAKIKEIIVGLSVSDDDDCC